MAPSVEIPNENPEAGQQIEMSANEQNDDVRDTSANNEVRDNRIPNEIRENCANNEIQANNTRNVRIQNRCIYCVQSTQVYEVQDTCETHDVDNCENDIQNDIPNNCVNPFRCKNIRTRKGISYVGAISLIILGVGNIGYSIALYQFPPVWINISLISFSSPFFIGFGCWFIYTIHSPNKFKWWFAILCTLMTIAWTIAMIVFTGRGIAAETTVEHVEVPPAFLTVTMFPAMPTNPTSSIDCHETAKLILYITIMLHCGVQFAIIMWAAFNACRICGETNAQREEVNLA